MSPIGSISSIRKVYIPTESYYYMYDALRFVYVYPLYVIVVHIIFAHLPLNVLFHRRGYKNRFTEMLFQDHLILDQNYMHRSNSIENASFSTNCDIKTTKCEERHGRLYFGTATNTSKNNNTLE